MELVNKFLVVCFEGNKEFVELDDAVVYAKFNLGNIYDMSIESDIPMMSYC